MVECGKPWVASGILSNKVDDHGNGLFEPGPADVWIGGYLCEGGSCPFTSVQRTVTLQGQFAPNAGWTYVGSGPLATSTGLTASVRYPSGVEAGDLLFMSCQGRRNTMRWSAPGFSWILDYDDWPGGPPGLRHAILYRWADGSEASHVSARNSTGVNGWSCVISAFRGETGPGPVWAPGGGTIGGPTQIMTNHIGNVRGYLVLDWFVSADDNNHGSPSHGTLAFGGPAYDTTIGTDHAVSMAYYVGNASLGPHTMRQLARGGDPFTSHAIPLRPVQ